MAKRTDDDSSDIASGLNTRVEYGGRSYHVQTQCSERGAPVIESLVFQGGQTLVRMTASFDDVAERLGFNGDDGKHLLELQHDDLIRKIRHGMLRDDDTNAPETAEVTKSAQIVRVEDLMVDPTQVEDPEVRELLQQLGVALEQVCPEPVAAEPESSDAPTRGPRRS